MRTAPRAVFDGQKALEVGAIREEPAVRGEHTAIGLCVDLGNPCPGG